MEFMIETREVSRAHLPVVALQSPNFRLNGAKACTPPKDAPSLICNIYVNAGRSILAWVYVLSTHYPKKMFPKLYTATMNIKRGVTVVHASLDTLKTLP